VRSCRGVFELLGPQGIDLFPLLRRRIVDDENLDPLADVTVERLRLALVEVNLVAILEAEDDTRVLLVSRTACGPSRLLAASGMEFG
jgi:hypothetical protein